MIKKYVYKNVYNKIFFKFISHQNVLVFRLTSLAKRVTITILSEIEKTHDLTLEKQIFVSLKHHIITKNISQYNKHRLRRLEAAIAGVLLV